MTEWYCHTCKKMIQHMGVASHRAAHRRRGDVFEMSSEKYRYSYDYSNQSTDSRTEES